MKIHFIGHACIVAECADTSILMDPWLSGKIFNNSWTLRPDPVLDPSLLDRIDYIWISHEHPDHCHFPTLGSFPDSFKQRVTILFQTRDSAKMLAAFKGLGYQHFRLLPHRELVPLTAQSTSTRGTKVYCYHAGLMDSALAVIDDQQVILNANDARISTSECKLILKDLKHVDVLLNQFSLAAYAGFEPPERYLPERALQVLRNVSEVHRALDAKVTIPFASFIYFSSEDNKYVNPFANTVGDAYDYLNKQGQAAAVLYPGDIYEIGAPHDSSQALQRYAALPGWDELAYDPIETKPLSDIFDAYRVMSQQIIERYPRALLLLLRPVTIRIPDLDKTVEFSLAKGQIDGDSRILSARPVDQFSTAMVRIQVSIRDSDSRSISSIQAASEFPKLEDASNPLLVEQRRHLPETEVRVHYGFHELRAQQARRRHDPGRSLLPNFAVKTRDEFDNPVPFPRGKG